MNLSDFPGITELFEKCFDEVESVVKAPKQANQMAYTQPRTTAASYRDPLTQAGVVTSEDGSVEISSGRIEGSSTKSGGASSIVLRADGSIVIIAPAGVNVLGPINPVGMTSPSIGGSESTILSGANSTTTVSPDGITILNTDHMISVTITADGLKLSGYVDNTKNGFIPFASIMSRS